jgi:hypothetical protein
MDIDKSYSLSIIFSNFSLNDSFDEVYYIILYYKYTYYIIDKEKSDIYI